MPASQLLTEVGEGIETEGHVEARRDAVPECTHRQGDQTLHQLTPDWQPLVYVVCEPCLDAGVPPPHQQPHVLRYLHAPVEGQEVAPPLAELLVAAVPAAHIDGAAVVPQRITACECAEQPHVQVGVFVALLLQPQPGGKTRHLGEVPGHDDLAPLAEDRHADIRQPPPERGRAEGGRQQPVEGKQGDQDKVAEEVQTRVERPVDGEGGHVSE
mmetsp:Transcript_41592/g.103800  ORF Transcript_41592/g.103800 Transcript_41592/m.103800 type:complete len:213 (+) Transcript_41592:967-1605(+)